VHGIQLYRPSKFCFQLVLVGVFRVLPKSRQAKGTRSQQKRGASQPEMLLAAAGVGRHGDLSLQYNGRAKLSHLSIYADGLICTVRAEPHLRPSALHCTGRAPSPPVQSLFLLRADNPPRLRFICENQRQFARCLLHLPVRLRRVLQRVEPCYNRCIINHVRMNVNICQRHINLIR